MSEVEEGAGLADVRIGLRLVGRAGASRLRLLLRLVGLGLRVLRPDVGVGVVLRTVDVLVRGRVAGRILTVAIGLVGAAAVLGFDVAQRGDAGALALVGLVGGFGLLVLVGVAGVVRLLLL